ncbi:ABC transporter substrate-binding protein [Wohlfahrtiimonas chitiniclastica]|uniref:ABC transporter substrate-binding protein n=2 Tax=Wohlfahrtiimonas chitiniclastica TaxID=400946 RepID=A0A165I074_9GAMM|nr:MULTISPECIES: ABC transporter substrate-binding protein [Wohlfahrtiimonas]ELV08764.1 Putative phospholipid-binding protein mlaC [Wohlfahrtiimonas chitiniclastica SH04]KZS22426.1 phospholipid-binding protein mlaC [Wohlfahrtiimonas chitiniclastica]KZX37951.1 phospholipid-binding protein mlaC [Wohlfahrtiimonas chitiniclastica]MBS7813976.1 ABC transporter substrate-binding protein [Wohlfahrtiimonas chitiniclastica]MBS7816239.1 ABC transporter substrate-binding protein [Wohlfahrtiimonas chitinic
MKLVKLLKSVALMVVVSMCSMVYAADTPEQTIEKASAQLINALKKEETALKQNPKRLYGFIEKMAVPYFDFNTMSQWVMGRAWRDATPAQRDRFMNEFKKLLINAYGSALLEYTDDKVNVFPLPPNAKNKNEVTVRSEITSSSHKPVAVNYSMIKSGGKWLVYDVSIEGVSIVTSYRTEIRELVNAKGIDGMIETLAQKNK